VDHERGLAVRVAAGLPVDEAVVTDVEHPVVVGFDQRVHLGHVRGTQLSRTLASIRRSIAYRESLRVARRLGAVDGLSVLGWIDRAACPASRDPGHMSLVDAVTRQP